LLIYFLRICHVALSLCNKNKLKEASAAEIAERYAALTCKQNKRYRTSSRLTKTRDRCCYGNDNGTDGQTDGQTDGRTDRQTDRVRRNMRPPPREEGRITSCAHGDTICLRRCKLTIYSHLFARWHLFRHVGCLKHQQQVDL